MSDHINHLEQYKMLREEIMQCIREISQFQFAAALAIGTIYPWLIAHKQDVSSRLVWYIAPAIAIYCGLKCLDLVIRIKIISGYLRRLEHAAFTDPALPGWERYLEDRALKFYDIAAVCAATLAWLLMIGLSIAASWYFSQ